MMNQTMAHWRDEIAADPLPDTADTPLRRAQRKRRAVLMQLKQREHLDVATCDYGAYDPGHVPLADCDDCGATPEAVPKISRDPLRWRVECDFCGKRPPEPRKYAWAAALAWNAINLGSQHYQDIPLFGLHELSPPEAHARMVHIRTNLELRVALAHAERSIARLGTRRDRKPPGRSYQRRLDAYLAWALLAQRLIKQANG